MHIAIWLTITMCMYNFP